MFVSAYWSRWCHIPHECKRITSYERHSIPRSLLLRDVKQHWLAVSYRHFETAYRSHLQGSSSPLILEDGTDSVPKRWLLTASQCCLTSRKSEDLIYTTVKAWNHTNFILFIITIYFFPQNLNVLKTVVHLCRMFGLKKWIFWRHNPNFNFLTLLEEKWVLWTRDGFIEHSLRWENITS
jgi:hypothetical protein